MHIFHGPANIAGIGGHLAEYQRSRGHRAEFVVWTPKHLFQNHDRALFPDGYPSYGHLAVGALSLFFTSLFRYDLFHFYYGRSLLPLGLDLPILRLLGRKIVMTYCGSDVRLAEVERRRNPYWSRIERLLAGTVDGPGHDFGKRARMRWHGRWCHRVTAMRNQYAPARLCVPPHKIVADIWLNNLSAHTVPDVGPRPSRAGDPVRLLHAPSSPRLKGTAYFRAAVDDLLAEGHAIEYVELRDEPHENLLPAVRDADVVLDQLLVGGFGSLAVEGMASCRPVVCYLIDEVRERHYPDCPVVNANIDDVKDVLRSLILDADRRRDLGRRGREFFERHFDYRSVNERVLEMYESL